MKKLVEKGHCAKCVEDALGYNEKTWSRAFYKVGCKSDMVDSNVSETFNGWILKPKQKPIISMLENIRLMVMKRLLAIRAFQAKWMIDIAPKALKLV